MPVAGADREAVDRVTADLVAPCATPSADDDEVPVDVLGGTARRPDARADGSRAPAWAEIAATTRPRPAPTLDRADGRDRARPRRPVLWHGEPGTGKSYALRALDPRVAALVRAHFITDPETFLGSDAGYLLERSCAPRGRAGDDAGG